MVEFNPQPKPEKREPKKPKPIARSKKPLKRTPLKRSSNPIAKTSKNKVPSLLKKLEKVFNEFIRLRDSKPFQFKAFKCISCGRIKPIVTYQKGGSNYHAGHYFPTTFSALRFNEKNVNGQCDQCNTYKHGNLAEYTKRLTEKIGEQSMLLLDAGKNNKVKWHGFELEAMIKEYKAKVKELKAEKQKNV